MISQEVVRNLPKALISWYGFETGAEVLFIAGGDTACEALYEALEDKGVSLSRLTVHELEEDGGKIRILHESGRRYDYIVGAGVIERAVSPAVLLERCKSLLKPSGQMLVGAENRLAVRNFCGDKDIFSGHVLDGIDGYANVSKGRREIIGGRAYAKSELEKMLRDVGFPDVQFYSVFPCLVRPQLILADTYLPNEPIEARVFPQYNSPGTVFLWEERLYRPLMDNHMFHQMANAFLIICSMGRDDTRFDQVTVQGDRSRGEAMATIIRYKESVTKRALYTEGQKKISAMAENDAYLRQHNVPVVEARLENDTYVMPYIDAAIATDYFRELLRNDQNAFIRELGGFRQLILDSSEHIPYRKVNWRQFEPGWEKRREDDPNMEKWEKLASGTEQERRDIGAILERGYVDLVSLNCFHTEKGFLFFDQEFYVESFPANAVFIRTIDLIYRDCPELEDIYPKDDLLKQFDLYEHRSTWRAFNSDFLMNLRNEKGLMVYHQRYRRNGKVVQANRHRMDYNQEEYERLFTNIFKGVGNKKIYLFGSGYYAEQFITQFRQYFEIEGIVDNNEEKWGREVMGIRIYPPLLLERTNDPFKIFICIKFFEDVLLQLRGMGVREISVYNPAIDYERPVRMAYGQEKAVSKRYHIGYVAGVFDLFHIGHLNLLRRAKEQCDYLIAGVVTDEQVVNTKRTRPYIKCDDRLAIVQACRYVDEAVKIPADRPGTEEAFYRYHFDVQFSGSDYIDDPYWLAQQVFLRQHGSDLVFFPYTQGTSSTAIKAQLADERKNT